MDIHTAIEKLEPEWEEDGGFFGGLRYGKFDKAQLDNLIATISSIEISSETTALDKRFVELIWFIPTFMSWQIERFKEYGEDTKELESGQHIIVEQLFRLLGVP